MHLRWKQNNSPLRRVISGYEHFRNNNIIIINLKNRLQWLKKGEYQSEALCLVPKCLVIQIIVLVIGFLKCQLICV